MTKFLKILLVVDLVAVNVGLGYVAYRLIAEPRGTLPAMNVPIVEEGCGEMCVEEIVNRVVRQTEKNISDVNSPSVTSVPTSKPVSQTIASPRKVRREEILTVPGSGSTVANEWTDLSGTEFYFDTRDYPGVVEVYFEANIKLINGNGLAYVRLFDITNGIGVNGSENNTANQADTWTKSQKVYFWAGRNLIRVQAKSLTADTTTFNTGRLRIVTEN